MVSGADGKRSRCASRGSIRSPGLPRSCCQGIGKARNALTGRSTRQSSIAPHSDRAGNTVQRRSSPSSAADAKPGFRSHDGVVTLGPCHAPFVAFANLGSPADGHHPERCRHHRNGPRPGPADPRRRGRTRLRCRGAAGCGLRASWPGPLRPTGWSSSGGSGPDPGLDAVAPGPHPPAGLRPAAKARSAPAPPQFTPAAAKPPHRRRGR